jgi:ATP-dependent helicase/nuclease subunit A
MLAARGRPIRPGDIMVLVRRRTRFIDELVRRLKQRGIAIAGVDRMVLTEQLAVMDLMALGQFLLLPDDDLTLATVLKGPLVGLTEEELFTLAHGRGTRRLWDVLKAHAGASAPRTAGSPTFSPGSTMRPRRSFTPTSSLPVTAAARS